MPGAKDVISLLKEEGHTLIVITARGKLNKDLIPVTIQRLKITILTYLKNIIGELIIKRKFVSKKK